MKTRFYGGRLYQGDAIQRTEGQNDCLAIECIIHLRRQNTTRASTRVFPVEILSHIFSCVLYDTESISIGQRAFVRLGHVCSKWRDIILSIPHFWSKFQLDVEGQSCKILDLPLLLLYVKNSGNSPFCLVVSFGRCDSHPLDSVKKSFKRLQQHVPRVHALAVLYALALAWRSVLSILVVLHWESDHLGLRRRITTGARLVKNPRLANWFLYIFTHAVSQPCLVLCFTRQMGSTQKGLSAF